VDVIRLNDINTGHDNYRQMAHRARVASIACPDALIDMDNWPLPDKAAWRSYLTHQPRTGIPSIYFASHIDSTQDPLTDEDYALIREVWEEYRQSRISCQSEVRIQNLQLSGSGIQAAGTSDFTLSRLSQVIDRKNNG
jgi:hypothetical protein